MARTRAAESEEPTGPEMTAAERQEVDDWVRSLIVKPVRTRCHTGPFLRWLAKGKEDGKPHVYTWQPETPAELAKAQIYYDAAHGRGAFAPPIKPGHPVRPLCHPAWRGT